LKKLFGVTVAMVTPLDEDGKIMESAVRQLVDFLIDKGVNCLYPGGTTGEMYLLTVAERKKLAGR
jgi:dihydrodipicolinate synthase/N-acetylneuraminate lyase